MTLGKERKEVSRLCHPKVKDQEQKFSFPRSSVAQKFASASAKTFFERRSREDFAQKRPEPFYFEKSFFLCGVEAGKAIRQSFDRKRTAAVIVRKTCDQNTLFSDITKAKASSSSFSRLIPFSRTLASLSFPTLSDFRFDLQKSERSGITRKRGGGESHFSSSF